ncbi:glucosamine--fructose-6-phosphate aminotransferase [isomerizing] 2 [Coprococcus sp. CAG:782]|uniref:glutamine--fructose-6-phosphate transaminase (isomerizing) n=1 Tax=Coprococcus sp. OM04-5BH TaxID=2293093 RepID=UPI000335ABE4|nr:glutamine--fructose-6-phosphate transaminase (isomerizing) [Coprococcus sp. OM04-5BH]MEE0036255.1 glutamine--fructose-6-phosphate transaminase (isomerizing) [Coprococcus sp.]RHV34289.1 glutamine--fructose-6-phosphate transaminase (isomerizing) [Coprococcus sp. OM04-5BH]CCY54632.1 glucosamine--fructose-6-phosphate aminotransferase [isomerizing] 2 [Coprococcus sp. CAG:782]
MCGIIGFTGSLPAKDILIDGLARLEYRGYDSAGIALLNDDDTLTIRKKAGRVDELRAMCSDREYTSTCGIGHTRWATHGGVTDINAHPHKCGKVAIIHNGIIENYYDIIREYGLADMLVSETDTEVVAALLDKLYDGDPVKTIKKAVNIISGSFALCIMFADHPGKIYAVRNVSPMVAASSEKGSIIASDLTAIISFSKEYFVVPEYHILTMTEEGIKVEDMKGNVVKPQMLEITWDIEAAQKGGFPHYMLKEIYEQPDSLRNTITPRVVDGLPDFTEDGIDDEVFKNCTNITVVACGTAMHAGIVGKAMIEAELKIPVNVEIASEFRYKEPLIDDKTLVIVTSQSGETIDTLEALRLAKRCGSKVLSVVNVKGSTIARESDYVLYTHAGPEIAVASTKAYSVQMAAMYLIGCRIGLVKGIYTEEKARQFIASLLSVIPVIEETLKQADRVKEVANYIKMAPDAFFIGRGIDYTLSLEGALKLKEISYVHAEAYAAGELKHGTIALITENVPVIALATQEAVYGKMISNIREVKARGAYVILISMDDKVDDKTVCDKHIRIPKQDNLFSVFATAVILQLIAYYTSDAKGLDVDKPRNLAKSVTVE